jgi:toxin ParE1/3/4
MSRYRLDARAQMDLKGIRHQIVADNNLSVAARIIAALRHRIRLLAQNPEAGECVKEFGIGLRRSSVGPYVIYYRCSSGWVEIARVLHGARDAQSEF